MNIQVNRIAGKLKELFDGKIDLSDVKTENQELTFLSRALALYGIIMNTDCTVEDVLNSSTDGYHDNGVDAVYCDDNQKVMYLIQSKWSNDGKHSISQGDTSNFISGISKILNSNFDGFNNKFDSLKDSICKAILSTEYKIKVIIIYTSNQQFSKECRETIESFINSANDGIDIISYSVLNLNEVYKSLAKQNNSAINLSGICLQDFGILERNEKEIGYYGKLSISVIAEWWKEHGLHLFSKNIRYYQGDTEVNAGIKDVLMHEPENFLLFNNGIKIVAEKINKAPMGSNGRRLGVFSLENASIVNGAQTTGAIGEIFDFLDTGKDNAFVLVQMINLETLSAGINDRITKYSNTQNRIDNKDFVSLDPFQKKLQEDFAMEGIEYYYKSGYIIKDDEKSCSVDDVAIAIGCGINDIALVATIKSNYGKIFERIDKPPYTDIFSKKHSTFFIWNCIQIYRRFEFINAKYQKRNNGTSRLFSVHGNRFLLFVFLSIFYEKLDLTSQVLEDDDLSELAKLIDAKISSIIDALIEIKNEKFPEAYPANIFKNGNRCEQLYKQLVETDIYKSVKKQGATV